MRKIFKFMNRFWLEVISTFLLIVTIVINLLYYDCFSNINTGSFDLIVTLLPLVITVLSIVLSLPKDLIYGLEKTEFRKFKGSSKYDFLSMLNIVIIIFTILILVSIFSLTLTSWMLSIISIIYSLCFLFQEIPLLMHSDKKIEEIIKQNIWNDVTNENLDIVLHNLLFKKGIIYAYKMLEVKWDIERSRSYLDKLLDLQNSYFWRYLDNY